MKEKILHILAIICAIVVISFIVFVVIAYLNMMDDHYCWIDGYQGEHCQKYIRGDN